MIWIYYIFGLSSYHDITILIGSSYLAIDITILVSLVILMLLFLFFLIIYHVSTKIT